MNRLEASLRSFPPLIPDVMAVVDSAFAALLARGGEDNMELWRVQKMQLVPVRKR